MTLVVDGEVFVVAVSRRQFAARVAETVDGDAVPALVSASPLVRGGAGITCKVVAVRVDAAGIEAAACAGNIPCSGGRRDLEEQLHDASKYGQELLVLCEEASRPRRYVVAVLPG